MSFADDLLQQANDLVHKDPINPKQASLRRAVSAAYYALFHFLIGESVDNWNRDDLRATLGRAFDHGPMKGASNRVLNSQIFPFVGEDPAVVLNLKFVASAFVQLQEKRIIADYDNTIFWSHTEALDQVKLAENAFVTWNLIRSEQIAQAYLVSFLVKNRG